VLGATALLPVLDRAADSVPINRPHALPFALRSTSPARCNCND